MTKTVLILGASGRFGRNAKLAFAAGGWRVETFNRDTDDLNAKAKRAEVIVNAWNPTYDLWETDVPALTQRVIEAAKLSDATVIIPGNVYVFGQHAPARLDHETPHHATNPLGRIRVEMERTYRASGVKTIILRGGDFIDTEASGNWFDMVMIKDIAKGRFVVPGDLTARRAWAYLPDIARAAVLLAEKREELARFEDIAFPGYTLSGEDIAESLARVVEHPVRAKRMSWLPIYIAKPFWKLAKGMIEMRYIWSKEHWLDGAKFARACPDFEPTPLEEALRASLGAVDIHPDEPVAAGRAIAAE